MEEPTEHSLSTQPHTVVTDTTLSQKDRKRMKMTEEAPGGEVGQKAAEGTAVHDTMVVQEPKPFSSTEKKQTVLTGEFGKKIKYQHIVATMEH